MRFEEFLLSEMKGLAVFAGAVTGDPHLAEDVLSDALVIVSDRWARISEMDAPAAYARRVVVTTFLSDRRKAARMPTSRLSCALRETTSPRASSSRDSSTSSEVSMPLRALQSSSSTAATVFSVLAPLSRRRPPWEPLCCG